MYDFQEYGKTLIILLLIGLGYLFYRKIQDQKREHEDHEHQDA